MPPARHPDRLCAIHACSGALKTPACRSALEISWPVDIRDQPGLLRLPSQCCLRPRVRSRRVHSCEPREPSEMLARLVGRQRDDGQAEATADHGCDFLERNAFLIDSVIGAALNSFLKCEPIETRGINPVHA